MNSSTTTIMVLGGYGNFGARICRALAGDPTIRLLVTGRSASKAQRMATQVGGTAQGLALDHNTVDLSNILRTHGVDLVIHTAGPFQHQGYGVALACAQAGAHYIDLADGRRFVCDFPQALNSAFVAAGRSGICGASTVPALSSAVVEHLCEGWQRIDSIDICIAPAQRAPRGQATLAGVLSYCGKEIAVWQGARWQQRLGWASPEPVHFHRLRSRVGALCDIPDLELFPSHYRVRQRVWFAAALEVSLAQWSFAAIAALRARRLLRQPERLAGLLHRTGGVLDFLGTPLVAWLSTFAESMARVCCGIGLGTLPPMTIMGRRFLAWPPLSWRASWRRARAFPSGRTPAWAWFLLKPSLPNLPNGPC